MTVDKLYLVGFMGAGKTTVARALDMLRSQFDVVVAEVLRLSGMPQQRRPEPT